MSDVLVEKPKPFVTLITLNRPERMNAMAFDVMVPFKEALEQISYDNDTRVVVVTGAGSGFCAGADLEDPGWLDIFNGLTVPGIARRAMKILDDVIKTLHDMHQPVIELPMIQSVRYSTSLLRIFISWRNVRSSRRVIIASTSWHTFVLIWMPCIVLSRWRTYLQQQREGAGHASKAQNY